MDTLLAMYYDIIFDHLKTVDGDYCLMYYPYESRG
jgi:hypothetical protein